MQPESWQPECFADYLPRFVRLLDYPDNKHVRGQVPELFRVIVIQHPDLQECVITQSH
jgi:hypothetical protein